MKTREMWPWIWFAMWLILSSALFVWVGGCDQFRLGFKRAQMELNSRSSTISTTTS